MGSRKGTKYGGYSGIVYDAPDSGALSSNNFPKDMRRIEVGDAGRDSHSRTEMLALYSSWSPFLS